MGEGLGRIGITFCPGKCQPAAMSGSWKRDLGADLDVIANWGAAAVVTLLEEHELESLAVPHLGQAVAERHMQWFHLPIPDVTAPGSSFERQWDQAGEALRSLLRSGFDVLVHCKGGLGRAGTVCGRLLVELGWEPEQAILAIREVRPGSLETPHQEQHVLGLTAIAEAVPHRSHEAVDDRALGALLGLAVGDALGTTLEFTRRDQRQRVTDLVGGGPFRLQAGEWTDDTAMALALADSLLVTGGFNAEDLMTRFVSWWRSGEYSCTGTCFDIGTTTRDALYRYEQSGDPMAGRTDIYSAGNGSLMRLAPVALLSAGRDDVDLEKLAAEQSATTHASQACLDACKLFARMLRAAIEGAPRSGVLGLRLKDLDPAIAVVADGSWRGAARAQISSSGYVVHTLEAALWSVARTTSFEDAVILAANLGDDADTVAAVTGQLAGALYGLSAIPQDWLAKLAWVDRIKQMGLDLLNRRPVQ